jgi:transposase
MNIRYFVGIYISKSTLDWAVYDGKKMVLQTNSTNSIAGIKSALRLIKTLPDWTPLQAVFCMEHTARAAPRYL